MAETEEDLMGTPVAAEDEPATPPARRRGRRPKAATPAVSIETETLASVAKRTASTTGWSDADVDALQLLLMSVLVLLTGRIAAYTKEPSLKATEQEVNAVSEPLARITLRHVKLAKGKRGDVADILAITAAMVAYTIRVFDARDQQKQNELRQLNRMADPGTGWTPGASEAA